MNQFPLERWASKSPGRWILVMCLLFALFILASAIAPQEEMGEEPVIESQTTE